MKTKYLILLLATVLSCNIAFGQQDYNTSLYNQSLYNINPAFVGYEDALEANLQYKNHWIGFKGTPKNYQFQLFGRILKNVSGGINISSYKAGHLNNNLLKLTYAYHLMINEDMDLHFGLTAGLINSRFLAENALAYDKSDDLLIQGNIGANGLVSDFGILYSYKKAILGLSSPGIIGSELNYSTGSNEHKFNVKNNFLVFARYEYYASDEIILEPSVMYKSNSLAGYYVDIIARINYKKLVGAGIGYRTNSGILGMIDFLMKDKFVFSYCYDFGTAGKSKTGFGSHEIMLKYFIVPLKPKDSDGDGIPDKIDRCPKESGLPALRGCPDKDGDGIIDSEDQCPDVAGIAALKGCPDSDGDGITDANDKCPDAAGTIELSGCPDKDGDSIIDSEDQCPDVAGIAALKGCPDKDGDGIADHKDDCPDEAGLPKLRGCPDKDGDGIADKNDKCPDIAGIAANNGCPEIKKEEKEVIDMAVKGVEFKIGSTELTPESFKLLDPMADILVRKQMYKIDIAGHTDNIGDAKINLKLSQDRANAVAKYLLSKGVPAEQIISNGYGDTKPIVPNDTEEGRQKNRRVEFKIVF